MSKAKMDIQPLSDWALIALDVQEEMETESGIVIPDSVSVGSDRTKYGTVLALGPDCVGFEKGDHVVLDSYDQKSCEIDDTTIMVRSDSILAVKK